MSNSDKLINTIIQEKINPIPKWKFQLRNAILILLWFIFIITGAISFSIILFSVQQSDFVLLDHARHSVSEMIMVIVPIAWFSFLIIFIMGSLYAVYYSKKGYKFTFSKLMGLNLGLSLVTGILFFLLGGSVFFEKTFSTESGLFQSLEIKKQKMWNDPDRGSLSGIISKADDKTVILKDFKNKIWTVKIDSAIFSPVVEIEKGEKIKILGTKKDSVNFNAQRVMPWGGREMRGKRHKRWQD
ncbi:MAG: hypothetical protein ACM3PT_08180 [Deltaproteobacteria bacterium]